MFITANDLRDIEATVGHNCRASVTLAGIGLAIGITAYHDGSTYEFQRVFNQREMSDMLNPQQALEWLAIEAKAEFDARLMP